MSVRQLMPPVIVSASVASVAPGARCTAADAPSAEQQLNSTPQLPKVLEARRPMPPVIASVSMASAAPSASGTAADASNAKHGVSCPQCSGMGADASSA